MTMKMTEQWTLGGFHRGGALKIMRGTELIAEIASVPDQEAIAQQILAASKRCPVESSFCALVRFKNEADQ